MTAPSFDSSFDVLPIGRNFSPAGLMERQIELHSRYAATPALLPLKEAMTTSQDLYLNELLNLEHVREGP